MQQRSGFNLLIEKKTRNQVAALGTLKCIEIQQNHNQIAALGTLSCRTRS